MPEYFVRTRMIYLEHWNCCRVVKGGWQFFSWKELNCWMLNKSTYIRSILWNENDERWKFLSCEINAKSWWQTENNSCLFLPTVMPKNEELEINMQARVRLVYKICRVSFKNVSKCFFDVLMVMLMFAEERHEMKLCKMH